MEQSLQEKILSIAVASYQYGVSLHLEEEMPETLGKILAHCQERLLSYSYQEMALLIAYLHEVTESCYLEYFDLFPQPLVEVILNSSSIHGQMEKLREVEDLYYLFGIDLEKEKKEDFDQKVFSYYQRKCGQEKKDDLC